MFEMPDSGLSVGEAVAKFKSSQVPASEVEQPESNDVVDVSKDAEPEEAEQPEVAEVEAEESEVAEVEETTNEDDADELFYDVDGEEVSASVIKSWKSGHLMHSDYTRKTQAHAEEVTKFKSQQEAFKAKEQQLDEKLAEFEAVMGEDSVSADDLAEMREYEPDKYINYVEKKQKREKLLSESKALATKQSSNFEEEYGNFAKSQDGWLDGQKPTDKCKAEIEVMTAYADANGFTKDDVSGFKSQHFKALLDAARYNAGKTKADVMAKKVRKAPPITKPRQQGTTTIQSEIKAAEAKFKQTGTVDDAVKLARLKRQLKN
jgi:hypothetical protein